MAGKSDIKKKETSMQEKKEQTSINENNTICRDDQHINRAAQLRLWEIDRFFKCPVVGMCLTFSEQNQLLKKSGVSSKKKTPFEIHEMLVASAECENRLSKRIDNLLNRKFGKETAFLHGLDQEEFIAKCRTAFSNGDYVGVLWAAATRAELPHEYGMEIFGTIHMMMHWGAKKSIRLKQELTGLQEELSDMRQAVKEAIQAARTLRKENERLKQNQADLRITLAAAEKEKNELEEQIAGLGSRYRIAELEQENRMMKAHLDALFVNDKEKQRQMVLLEEKNMDLSSELEKERESNRHFRKEAREIIGEVFALNRCDANCPSFDLCKKRILIVGGLTRMESLYRDLIENSGGIFEYHDGYMKNGVKGLECRLKCADLVVCPVNCNSHAACAIVKNLAKKHHKTVHMLANFSLNAVSQAIGVPVTNRGTVN
jgi:regulator of replication initiation timing